MKKRTEAVQAVAKPGHLLEEQKKDDHYIFKNPGTVTLYGSANKGIEICRTSGEIWKWEVNGDKVSINWDSYGFNRALKEILKSFVFFRLRTRSAATVASRDTGFLKILSESGTLSSYPWKSADVIAFLQSLGITNNMSLYTLKRMYGFCIDRQITGFDGDLFDRICDVNLKTRKPYETTFLRQNHLDTISHSKMLDYLSATDKDINSTNFRNRVVLRLCIELSPRPSQIHHINELDLKEVPSRDKKNGSYFSLWLPMAKKISQVTKEKRERRISNVLGLDLKKLIAINKKAPTDAFSNDPLFRSYGSRPGRRLSSNQIQLIIANTLGPIGVSGVSATSLRHHLGQSLADQGANADVIADLLGHNSTLPARAYIAATPKISEIKTRALGKNNVYNDIMKMMQTGKIIDKKGKANERWVKGAIGFQYIGDIGVCGLDQNTTCPKNPVYSCYTCKKFHPFSNGEHQDVMDGIQKEVQHFIDSSENAMDLQHNRTVTQLETTIGAVRATIEFINSQKTS